MPRNTIFAAIVLAGLQAPAAAQWHNISGCVKDEKGAPVPGAAVRAKELEGFGFNFAVTADAKGCYRTTEVPGGAYEISAEKNGVTLARRQIVLEKKKDVVVDLVYQPVRTSAAAPGPPMINLKMLEGDATVPASAARSLLVAVSFDPKAVEGGQAAMGRVSLARPAPEGGVVVRLSAGNELISVPPEIRIDVGITGGSFPVKTSGVRGPSDLRVLVSATSGESKVTGELIVASSTRVAVMFEGEGSGRVISVPGGLLCRRGTCSHPFREGESVKLIAQPADGSVFLGWSGDCNEGGLVVVSGSMRCTAKFLRAEP